MQAVLTLLLAILFAAAPLVTDPFSGFRADQLPVPQVDPPVQPAGWAFSIWGVIYAWLIVSAAFGLWARRADADWQAARTPLVLSLAIGVPWLAIANASAIWATVTIFLMAAAAIAALLRAPVRDRWLLRAPVGLYAGWLTAASFVSLASTAAGYGFGDQLLWAYFSIALAALVAWAVQSRTAEWTYGLAVGWALLGIVVANLPALPLVAAVAGAALLLIAARATTRSRALP
ncbi:hypothetical protein [Wenxinia marina]|uniref:Uncharacterized protein n=1 Tax=Wenxinia marina DSM 24838 TaxID=1123501 RepID=A0A0D0QE96_9RHOB|nr:hypothetical protein [Wenxinia marina]KIQ69338.1 hypothetical protein Wenmar_01700 [Wenxinia marina DSM 24838]GGL57531.1 seryl-tRNA synthetase [Wenxinia marina]